jgi:sulfite dehydrogenase (quinone) subunit SoeC
VNPAYSVVLFTVSSGAGYGLLALLGLVGFNHGPASSPAFAIVTCLAALVLVTIGLLSSLFHLGHPERAWRALSQWRSSWLSREGIAAIATYPVALLFAATWSGLLHAPGFIAPLGLLLILMCTITVVCTAMIYRSLRTIRQWNHKLVVPAYLAFALATGAGLLPAIALPFGRFQIIQAILATAALGAVAAIKFIYWRHIDSVPRTHTTGEATGLGKNVRQWEAPHTNINFVQKEMGYAVARRHAQVLRKLVLGLLGLAAFAALLTFIIDPWVIQLAAPLTLAAAAVERWLFFAEAEHVVNLYYGGAAV